MRDLSSERARGLIIQVIMVVLRLGVGVTWAEVITLSPADPFMLLYQRLSWLRWLFELGAYFTGFIF